MTAKRPPSIWHFQVRRQARLCSEKVAIFRIESKGDATALIGWAMAFVIRTDRIYEGTIISIEVTSGFYYKSVRTTAAADKQLELRFGDFMQQWTTTCTEKKTILKEDMDVFLHLMSSELKSPKWSGHHFCKCNFAFRILCISHGLEKNCFEKSTKWKWQ